MRCRVTAADYLQSIPACVCVCVYVCACVQMEWRRCGWLVAAAVSGCAAVPSWQAGVVVLGCVPGAGTCVHGWVGAVRAG